MVQNKNLTNGFKTSFHSLEKFKRNTTATTIVLNFVQSKIILMMFNVHNTRSRLNTQQNKYLFENRGNNRHHFCKLFLMNKF